MRLCAHKCGSSDTYSCTLYCVNNWILKIRWASWRRQNSRRGRRNDRVFRFDPLRRVSSHVSHTGFLITFYRHAPSRSFCRRRRSNYNRLDIRFGRRQAPKSSSSLRSMHHPTHIHNTTNIYTYISLYIYLYVCVCVCITVNLT